MASASACHPRSATSSRTLAVYMHGGWGCETRTPYGEPLIRGCRFYSQYHSSSHLYDYPRGDPPIIKTSTVMLKRLLIIQSRYNLSNPGHQIRRCFWGRMGLGHHDQGAVAVGVFGASVSRVSPCLVLCDDSANFPLGSDATWLGRRALVSPPRHASARR